MNVEVDLGVGQLLNLVLQKLSALALLADDDAWSRCVDIDRAFRRRALDLDLADPRMTHLLLDDVFDGEVLVEPLGVALLRVPGR